MEHQEGTRPVFTRKTQSVGRENAGRLTNNNVALQEAGASSREALPFWGIPSYGAL